MKLQLIILPLLLVLYEGCQAQDIQVSGGGYVDAIIGDNVTLDCTVVSDDSVYIMWTGPDGSDIMDTYYENVTDDGTLSGSGSGALYDTIIRRSTITISSVTLNDAGNYTCSVYYDSRNKTQEVFLDVIVPPPPNVYAVSVDLVSYGASVTLQCNITSLATPTIEWTTNATNMAVPASNLTALGNDNYYSVLVLNAVTEDEVGTYTCTATNSGGTTADDVLVELVSAPEVVVSPSGPLSVDYWDDVTLQCTVTTTYPEGLGILWSTTANNMDLNVVMDATDTGANSYTSNVTLLSVTEQESGTYTCTVDNGGWTVSESVIVIVSDPVFDVTVSPLSPVPYNDSISINCTVVSDVPVNITWTTTAAYTIVPDDILTDVEEDMSTYTYTSLLYLDYVDLMDEGDYTCTGTSALGSVADTVSLNVTVPLPQATVIGNTNVTIGSDNTYMCEAEGVELSYSWIYFPFLEVEGENTSTLTIINVTSLGLGDFIIGCTVTDILERTATDSVTLSIIYPSILDFDNAKIFPFSGMDFSVSCTAQNAPGTPGDITILWFLRGLLVDETSRGVVSIVTSDEDADRIVTSTITLNFVVVNTTTRSTIQNLNILCIASVDDPNYANDRVDSAVKLIEIQYAPFIHNYDYTRTPVRGRDEVMVQCSGYGSPLTVASIIKDNTTVLVQNSLGIITYSNPHTTFNDTGTYTCEFENDLGRSALDFYVQVIDVPNNISGVTAEQVDFTVFDLSWTAPFNNYDPITIYQICRRLSVAEEGFCNYSPTPSFTLNRLNIDSEYFVSVAACNTAGCGSAGENILIGTATPDDARLSSVYIPRIFITPTSIFLEWTFSDLSLASIDEYNISRVDITYVQYTNNGRKPMMTVKADYPATNLTIMSFEPGTLVEFQIQAVYDVLYNDDQFLGSEQRLDATTLGEDNEPNDIFAEISDNLINDQDSPSFVITWEPLTEEDGASYLTRYIVSIVISSRVPGDDTRRRRQNDNQRMIPVGLDTSYTFEDVKPFQEYGTQILADLGALGLRPLTGVSTVTSGPSAPSEPEDFQATEVTFTRVMLQWTTPVSPNGIVVQYNISWYKTSDLTTPLGSTVQGFTTFSYHATGLDGHTNYTFAITAATSTLDDPQFSDATYEGPSQPGNTSTITVLTQAGVYPVGTPAVEEISGANDRISLVIPELSDRYGPLSHFKIIVVETVPSSSYEEDTLLPSTNSNWRTYGYYVAGVYDASDHDNTITVGDNSRTSRDGQDYVSSPFDGDISVNFLLRVYSAAETPYQSYDDSDLSILVQFSKSTVDLVVILVPIFIVLVVITVVIIIVIIVIYCVLNKKTKRLAHGYYIDELKMDEPYKANSLAAAVNMRRHSNGKPGGGDMEMRNTQLYSPNLSVPTSEIFTSVGQPFTLVCDTSSTTPLTVTWSKDSQLLIGPRYYMLSDNSLYVHDAELSDEGVYIIAASNLAGTVEEMIRVTITAPIAPNSSESHPPITVSNFTESMARSRMDDGEHLEQEYHDIDLEWNFTTYAAKHPINHNKNRYVNIIPYDHSRVPLSIQDNTTGSDYINASYINGYNTPRSYIATQGPIPTTFADFWRMVWELDIPTIVMVTNLKEDDKIKCHQYWPSFGSTNYANVQVTLKGVESIVDYSIRTFHIQPLDDRKLPAREVRQFHFTVWPDHGVPQYATALLQFRKRVRKYHSFKNGPMLVHCSAGVGRTGTFITIDSMCDKIAQEGYVDIFNFVRQMRFCRNYMVQTAIQYEFIHEALLEAIMCGDTSIAFKSLPSTIQELSEVDPSTGKNGFLTQYETLIASSPSDSEFDCSIAQLPDNISKSRITKHLPSNDYRVKLSTTNHQSDYICASYLDGYRHKNAFIITQGPMKNTAGDFWRMVWELKSAAIVMLTSLEEGGEEQCVQYWPNSSEEMELYGSFQVESCPEERVLTDYTVRKFKLSPVDNPQESRTITQLHYTKWSFKECPENALAINDLIEELLRVQRKSGNGPVTVHCSDGLGRTGTFCSLFSIRERAKAEGVVDVFSAVKGLRTQRPGLVQSLDQYVFIHNAVVEFLNTFDNYDNFNM